MGRKKAYREDEVLMKAMSTFWENGYQGTSIRTLEKNMGINQFSIYASFNSKKELFVRALDSYETYVKEHCLSDLNKPDCTIEDVASFFKTFGQQIHSKALPNSCLIVNTTSELSPEDAEIKKVVVQFFEKMKYLFTQAIENSIQHHLMPGNTDVDQTAEYLTGIAQSISIYAKIKTKPQIDAYVDFSISQITK